MSEGKKTSSPGVPASSRNLEVKLRSMRLDIPQASVQYGTVARTAPLCQLDGGKRELGGGKAVTPTRGRKIPPVIQ